MEKLISVLLTVAFVVLKLTKAISWSWVWVLSPIWIYALILGFLFILTCVFAKMIGKEDTEEILNKKFGV